jgi:hypothetical protein
VVFVVSFFSRGEKFFLPPAVARPFAFSLLPSARTLALAGYHTAVTSACTRMMRLHIYIYSAVNSGGMGTQ